MYIINEKGLHTKQFSGRGDIRIYIVTRFIAEVKPNFCRRPERTQYTRSSNHPLGRKIVLISGRLERIVRAFSLNYCRNEGWPTVRGTIVIDATTPSPRINRDFLFVKR